MPASMAAVGALCFLIASRRVWWLLPVACAFAGAARGGREPAPVPTGVIVDDRGVDRIEGTVNGHRIGEVWIWTEEPLRDGERVAVHGRVKTPRGSLGPGQPDRAAAMRARGATLEVTALQIERIADDPTRIDRVMRWAADTQATWSARIDHAGGDASARAALRGIVTGDRAAIPESLDARWRAVGIFHVLSVSGLHLAVVAGLAFAMLRRLIAALPFGGRIRPARWAAVPALAIAIAYTLVTGAQIATVRALVVIVLVVIGASLDRPLRPLDAIGVAAFCVLWWRPADLLDPSFQLSFVAAIVLALSARRTEGKSWLVRGLVASLWVTLATAPITALHFHQLTPGGIAGNVVLTPLLELVALPLALFGVAIDWDLPIRIATFLVEHVDTVAGWLEHAMPVGRIAIAHGVTALAIVACTIGLARTTRKVGWLVLCIAWSLGGMRAPSGELRVTFVDVGQGDAAIVELPDGDTWLIDAGGTTSKPIDRTLAVYGKHRVQLAIVSHPHPDHYASLGSLAVPIDELWSAGGATSPSFDAIARRATRHVHPPLGLAREQAGVQLIVWAPRYEDRAAIDPVRTVNDNSLVVELRYRGRSILFSGDLEAEGEEALVAAGLRPVDIVKVPHHGSPTSSTPAFVAATHPALAVISCGRANQFGFPSPAVLARWGAAGADVARTDLDGSVTIRVDASGELVTERFATPAR
jgi:competence protein ComEC